MNGRYRHPISKSLLPRIDRERPRAGALQIQDEGGRLFDMFLGRQGRGRWPTEVIGLPSLGVYAGDHARVVRVELPGIRQEEMEISLHGDILGINGEGKPNANVKEEAFCRRERRSGPFQRTLKLPSIVDASRVTATYWEGVLEVHLATREETRARTVKVEPA